MKETILWTVIETNEIGDTRLMWTFDDEKQANNYVTQLENEDERLQQIAPNSPVYYAAVKNKAISIRNPNFIRPWLHILEPIYGYLILGEKLFNNPKKYSGPWNFGTKKNNIANVLKIVNEIIEYWGKGNIRLEKNTGNIDVNITKRMAITCNILENGTESIEASNKIYITIKI